MFLIYWLKVKLWIMYRFEAIQCLKSLSKASGDETNKQSSRGQRCKGGKSGDEKRELLPGEFE